MPVMLAFRCRVSLRSTLPLLIVPVVCLIATQARAQSREGESDDWQVMLGAGAIYTPDYEGSDEFELQPFPFISVAYRDIAYIRGPEIGVNLIRLQVSDDFSIKAGPFARFRRDRPEKRNADLRGLGDVDFAVELGGAVALEYKQAFVRVSLAKDVAGGHDGLVGEGEAGVRFNLSDTLIASASASASWADKDYMGTYFSVTAAQAARSGLPVYRAEAGLKDVGAGLNLSYMLGRNWMVTAIGGYSRLMGDAADAPLVVQRGSPDQWRGGLFLAYRF
ncbi:MipA/OmpV family protein [Sphingomonas sp.]|uniref:MipA/OmpV family protein n=1 Tax=Sphingomonas sp. TaxID=28214 RepID=UPI002EDBA3FC